MNYETQIAVKKFAEKIQPIYEFMSWEWFDTGVPSVQQIESNLTRLIDNLLQDEDCTMTRTGGLFVEKTTTENDGTEYVFGFVMDEYFYPYGT